MEESPKLHLTYLVRIYMNSCSTPQISDPETSKGWYNIIPACITESQYTQIMFIGGIMGTLGEWRILQFHQGE